MARFDLDNLLALVCAIAAAGLYISGSYDKATCLGILACFWTLQSIRQCINDRR